MMGVSVVLVKVVMETIEVADKDERSEVVVEGMTVVFYDGRCMYRARAQVVDVFFVDIVSLWVLH